MQLEFATATQILFGRGSVQKVVPWVKQLGVRPMLLTGSTPHRAEPVRQALAAAGYAPTLFSVAGEPSTDDAERGVLVGRDRGCDVVVGLGGGSVIDTAKAVAALLGNGGVPLDYLEGGVGAGRKLTRPSLPVIAVPTTAGTGAEVTRNAVLAAKDHRVKVSLRALSMLPRAAVVDPALTDSMPPQVTASTGLDALTQVLEPFVSSKANPLVDAICREGLRRVSVALRRAYADGTDAAARDEMALVSVLGGMALANAALGAVHGFAGPAGGMLGCPHGAVCARLLPFVVEANVAALRARAPDSAALGRYDTAAQLLTGHDRARAGDVASWLGELCDDLAIPSLGSYGMTEADLPALVDKAAAASSMKGNPIVLTRDELLAIARRAL